MGILYKLCNRSKFINLISAALAGPNPYIHRNEREEIVKTHAIYFCSLVWNRSPHCFARRCVQGSAELKISVLVKTFIMTRTAVNENEQRLPVWRAGSNITGRSGTAGETKPPRARQAVSETQISVLRQIPNVRAKLSELNSNMKIHFEMDRALLEDERKRSEKALQNRHEECMNALQSLSRQMGQRASRSGEEGRETTTVWQTYVKLKVSEQILDPSLRLRIYEGMPGTSRMPSSLISESVMYALGERASSADILRFLNRKVVPDGSRFFPQKAYSLISLANGRDLEPIRNELVRIGDTDNQISWSNRFVLKCIRT
ncbi:hypothetical protein FGB62_429g00 [Gracilaria domingensis]|nr:hypothetical protein FGB62_429g00 [Gracilaria domingensis]